jgi:hypothetical protein
VSCDLYFSRHTSPSNGRSYQTIKKNGRLVVTICVRRGLVHFKADGNAPYGILSNTPQHVGIDRCHSSLKLGHEIIHSPRSDCRCPHREQFIRVRFGRGGRAVGPRQPVHLSGSTTAGHFLLVRRSSVVLKPQALPHSYWHIFMQPR